MSEVLGKEIEKKIVERWGIKESKDKFSIGE